MEVIKMTETEKKTESTNNIVKVAAKSEPKKVAGALAKVVQEQGRAEVYAVGAAAVNQAVKSITIARSLLTLSGKDIITYPAFTTVTLEGESRTAITFFVENR